MEQQISTKLFIAVSVNNADYGATKRAGGAVAISMPGYFENEEYVFHAKVSNPEALFALGIVKAVNEIILNYDGELTEDAFNLVVVSRSLGWVKYPNEYVLKWLKLENRADENQRPDFESWKDVVALVNLGNTKFIKAAGNDLKVVNKLAKIAKESRTGDPGVAGGA